MTTNLVVADASRTEKTICLAVTPPLKARGIPGRPRLFEVIAQVKAANLARQRSAPGRRLVGSSFDDSALRADPSLAVSYITAPPQMAKYIEYSTRIYGIYLKYVAPEDIHVYSVDEVFVDLTPYLKTSRMSARAFLARMVRDVLHTTGITAAAGLGSNLYLAKVAMDIMAKHAEPDRYGVRIAELDEASYRTALWAHRPITDFWRVGRGYAARLERCGLHTMGDIARCSLSEGGEELLYKQFGVNAELLIDHAWGYEPCTIADIRAYRPSSSSISSGQVLSCPYDFGGARLVVREMADLLALTLVEKNLITDQLVLTVGYDAENLRSGRVYEGETVTDPYGRRIPRAAHGTVHLERACASSKAIIAAVTELYDRIVDPSLTVRRLNIAACRLAVEGSACADSAPRQLDLFTDYEALERERAAREAALARERSMQKAILAMKKKYGKNAVLRGMNLQRGATARARNGQIGGHRA